MAPNERRGRGPLAGLLVVSRARLEKAQWLIARGQTVVDVPTVATARVRELSRGGRRKTDVLDASAAASVAALHGDTNPVAAEGLGTVLAMLAERRVRACQDFCVS